MDIKKFRQKNGLTEWTYRKNKCAHHPETCNCEDWAIFADGRKFCTVYNKAKAKMVTQRMQIAEDLAQLTYDYTFAKIDGEEICDYVEKAMGMI